MPDLPFKPNQTKLPPNPPHKIEVTPRRVRALFDHQYIIDTTSARHVWEHPYYPVYYFPIDAVKPDILTVDRSHALGEGVFGATLKGERKSTDKVLVFESDVLAGLVRIDKEALDALFEEDEQVSVHLKDPYKRIDILPSSRKITVKIDGVTIADSSNNMFLFETMLRPRYYLPLSNLRWEYLSDSETTSFCPYKGMANYYHATVNGKKYEDVLWYYKYPTAESARVAGLACVYNEKVDVYVGEVLEEKGK